MTVLLKDALRPNLLQTTEHTPMMIHTGPFGNIAHGNSSVLADLAGLKLADYVVTESGFGADMGFEKFMDIKCRASGLLPDAAVVVCTVRALKMHSAGSASCPGGRSIPAWQQEDLESVEQGAVRTSRSTSRTCGARSAGGRRDQPLQDRYQAELDLVRKMALERGRSMRRSAGLGAAAMAAATWPTR